MGINHRRQKPSLKNRQHHQQQVLQEPERGDCIVNDARIRVVEDNVKYRTYGETATNFSNEQGEVGVQITYQDSSSYTFNRSLSLPSRPACL
ncbi:hypothetical protein SASPL_113800 [Salvia splendens]|uniref:Uncharacterized protein n=1 Tax=Salvia splendens TaxID=180675 RepID=A0A8X8XZJ0_SALSN|nr:hypothetical protein SASPL_113800 [Salvia splendens]